MRSNPWNHGAALAALVLGSAGAMLAATPEPTAEPLFLFQPLDQRGLKTATIVSIDLAPSAWRVGSAEGPTASAAQLQAVLKQLQAVVLAGRCAGDTREPRRCASVMDSPQFAGLTSEQAGGLVLGWVATDAAAVGSPARYFGLLQPERYSGPDSAAFGARLVMHFLVTPTDGPRTLFDDGDADVVIHNDSRGALASIPRSAVDGALAQRASTDLAGRDAR